MKSLKYTCKYVLLIARRLQIRVEHVFLDSNQLIMDFDAECPQRKLKID